MPALRRNPKDQVESETLNQEAGSLCFSERRGTRGDLGKGEGEGRGLGEGKGQTVLYVRKINKNLPLF